MRIVVADCAHATFGHPESYIWVLRSSWFRIRTSTKRAIGHLDTWITHLETNLSSAFGWKDLTSLHIILLDIWIWIVFGFLDISHFIWITYFEHFIWIFYWILGFGLYLDL